MIMKLNDVTFKIFNEKLKNIICFTPVNPNVLKFFFNFFKSCEKFLTSKHKCLNFDFFISNFSLDLKIQ